MSAARGLNAYHEALFDARMRALGRTLSTVGATRNAVHKAWVDTAKILDDGQISGLLAQRVARSRMRALEKVWNELGEELADSIVDEIKDTQKDVPGSYQSATSRIVTANKVRIDPTFSHVPRLALEQFIQRTSVTGTPLVLSPGVWSADQVQKIELKIAAGIARGQSAKSLGLDLEKHVLGGKGAGGMSVRAKAERLARTEINTAYWEASALSAASSSIVEGQRWNLSTSHKLWDACDMMAWNASYDLGPGIYPTGTLPPKPHPNCMCWLEDVLRDVDDWEKPRPPQPLNPPALVIHEDGLPARIRGKIGAGGEWAPNDLSQWVEGRPISERLHLTARMAANAGQLSTELFHAGGIKANMWQDALQTATVEGNIPRPRRRAREGS